MNTNVDMLKGVAFYVSLFQDETGIVKRPEEYLYICARNYCDIMDYLIEIDLAGKQIKRFEHHEP